MLLRKEVWLATREEYRLRLKLRLVKSAGKKNNSGKRQTEVSSTSVNLTCDTTLLKWGYFNIKSLILHITLYLLQQYVKERVLPCVAALLQLFTHFQDSELIQVAAVSYFQFLEIWLCFILLPKFATTWDPKWFIFSLSPMDSILSFINLCYYKVDKYSLRSTCITVWKYQIYHFRLWWV